MKRIFFFLLFLPCLLSAQNQRIKSSQLAVGINFTPVMFYLFDHPSEVSTTNNYNFQTGADISYYKVFQKNRIGFTTGLIYGTKNYKQVNPDTSQILFHQCTHHYSLLKVPLMIDYTYSFERVSAGGGIGLNLNYFLKGSCDFECVYNNGDTHDKFPNDLKFESFREFVVFVSVAYFFPKTKLALVFSPFLTRNLSDPIYFSQAYYNPGKTLIGLNLTLKRYFTFTENRK